MFTTPEYLITLAWFIAAIPVAMFFYYLSIKNKQGIRWSVIGTIIVVALCIGLQIQNTFVEKQDAARKPIYFGYLEPSDEQPVPSTTPANVVSLLLGNNLQVLTKAKSQLLLEAYGRPLLTLGSENNKIWLSTTITDSQNQIIVRIIKNEFQAFPEHSFNPVQPDSHSLSVRDSTGQDVLYLRFLNPRRILIHGRFAVSGSQTVTIDDDGLHFPGEISIGYLTLNMVDAPNAGPINFGK
jgi:hypothetical protein